MEEKSEGEIPRKPRKLIKCQKANGFKDTPQTHTHHYTTRSTVHVCVCPYLCVQDL